jgi:hypothetical protein
VGLPAVGQYKRQNLLPLFDITGMKKYPIIGMFLETYRRLCSQISEWGRIYVTIGKPII